MLENIDYNDPAVLETLKEMIEEIPFSGLEDIIKHNKALNKEFQKGGFHFDPKNKGRAEEIIYNDCKDDLNNKTVLFMKWYEKKPEYKRILEPYFTSHEYSNWDKKDIKTKSDELRKIEQAVFDELTAALPKNHVSYIMYFSYIEFDDELTAKWMELADQKDSERIDLLRQIVFKRNEEIFELKSKMTEDINNLNAKIQEFEEDFENQNKLIALLNTQLNERKSPAPEIETLKRQIETLSLKEKELEKLRNEGLTEFIETKKDEINAQLNEINRALEQKKYELEEISIKIKEEKEIKEALEELNALKRRELSEYVDKGEKWKKALLPGLLSEFREEKKPEIKFSRMTGERDVIGNYTDFEQLLESMDFSEDDTIRIREILTQLKNSSIIRVSKMDEMRQIEDFFQALGHKSGRFILHTDLSWLTPGSLWETKGYLDGCETPITFPDVATLALKNREIIFQVEILGANRAPIEGYFGPLLKALPQKRKIIMATQISEIPINMFFFLQLDSDDYCAKPSPLLDKSLLPVEVISLSKISKEIFVPFDVLFKEVL